MEAKSTFERLQESYEHDQEYKQIANFRLTNEKGELDQMFLEIDANWDIHRQTMVETAKNLFNKGTH